MAWTLHSFPTNALLVQTLAREIAELLSDSIAVRGRAAMAVSGGSTPRTLFEFLAGIDIPWRQVVVTLVDERWVDASDPASNALLVKEHLLQGMAAEAQFVSLKTSDLDPFAAVVTIDALLRERVLPLDLALLGMGEDGHTASFFKGAQGLEGALSSHTPNVCCGVRPHSAPHDRMTLTLATLLGAERLMLHCIGEEKLAVLQAAMLPGDIHELPVRAVLHQSVRMLEIYHAKH